MEAQQNSHQEQLQKLIDKIQDVKVAMLATFTEDGRMHSRPMYTHEVGQDGVVWFFTGKDSQKSREIQQNPYVCLNYSDASDDLYVSVGGRATLSEDQAKIDELWTENLKAWFPQGKNDPNIQLIGVEINEAEYWDTPDNKVVQLIGYVKARVTGEPYRPGENEKLNL